MRKDRRISQIIDISTPEITSSKETVNSILEKYPQYAAELRPRLEAVLWLNQARISCATRPGFIFDSRKYLETKIGSMEPISFWKRISMRYTPQRWVFNVTTLVILVVMLALIVNSAILTARLSIPGDPLYTTKLVLEDVRLALTFNHADKTNLYLQYSRERATEFVELVLEGDYQALPAQASRMETELIASLRSIQNLSPEGINAEQPMTSELRDTLSSEILLLTTLERASPPTAYPGIELAINVAQTGLLALR